jgi:hypothetical protein
MLLRVAQPVLAQYGRDIDVLRALVEPQTPQRLHIKIGPADDENRWEVPEFLIPRYGPVFSRLLGTSDNPVAESTDRCLLWCTCLCSMFDGHVACLIGHLQGHLPCC